MMYKIISVTNRNEIAFSLPKGEILSNKDTISRLASQVGLIINDSDIIKAQSFSDKYHMNVLVLIVNKDGISFLPDRYFKF